MILIILVGVFALAMFIVTPFAILCGGLCFSKFLGNINDEVIFEDDD